MAETALEKTTEIGAISPRGCTLITELPEIIINTFQYLKDEELDAGSQVCTLCRDIIVNIMYQRVTMITRKIPLIAIITAIHESENLRPYVGFKDHFQYNWFVLGDEPELTIQSKYGLIGFRESKLASIPSHKYMYFTHSLNRNSVTLPFPAHHEYSSTETTEIQILMFPKIPGFNISNYSFSLRGNESILRDKSDLIKEIKNVCHRNNIPDEQTKCVVFYKDIAIYSFEDETEHLLGFTDHRDVYRLTLFHDEKVNAFPVYIHIYAHQGTGYTTIKEKLERLKYSELKMVQKRCFAYIFRYACTDCIDAATRAFRKVFPLVKYVTYNFLPSYLSIISSEEEYFHVVDDDSIPCSTLMVFVWWE
ncbi:uncharacterized protein LOC111623030 [Centruroides sculpturatus]|uniref:uncharacterized protein LOC111623030 n=1 Tax=Centruroides sculpturatus TaxID=218467 RepID=UPI000C6CC575|nr:uncharacterized protein LOC111623030 [Centruroides sculpturatus]